jgi:hypothetical protein
MNISAVTFTLHSTFYGVQVSCNLLKRTSLPQVAQNPDEWSKQCVRLKTKIKSNKLHNMYFFSSFVTNTLDTRLDESNVGHQLLKKMGKSVLGSQYSFRSFQSFFLSKPAASGSPAWDQTFLWSWASNLQGTPFIWFLILKIIPFPIQSFRPIFTTFYYSSLSIFLYCLEYFLINKISLFSPFPIRLGRRRFG